MRVLVTTTSSNCATSSLIVTLIVSVEDAKKNLVRIPIVKGTLPHQQKGKFGGARVNIIPLDIDPDAQKFILM